MPTPTAAHMGASPLVWLVGLLVLGFAAALLLYQAAVGDAAAR